MQLIPGGTANLAVLGGNLPPRLGGRVTTPFGSLWAQFNARASRPPQRAGGPFHPDRYCIFPAGEPVSLRARPGDESPGYGRSPAGLRFGDTLSVHPLKVFLKPLLPF